MNGAEINRHIVGALVGLAPFIGSAADVRQRLIKSLGEDYLQRSDPFIRRYLLAKNVQAALHQQNTALTIQANGQITICAIEPPIDYDTAVKTMLVNLYRWCRMKVLL